VEKPLIAVVNDDTTFLELMNDLLADQGCRTILIKEGDKAYRTIRHEKPALVILDIRLEHAEGGWMVLELIRLDPETTNIPVIVTSADAAALKAKAEMLQAIGVDCLEKPFRLADLVRKVEKHLPNESGAG
jgi:CheY-like chemotaxis protein